MRIGNRTLKTVFKALFIKTHYIALANMPFVYRSFLPNLYRYLTGKGEYPYQPHLATLTGEVIPTLYTHHDLLTVNEIFCRHDYGNDHKVGVVVDFGSNIGISALFFLTRNSNSFCYLFEPDPRNVKKLVKNLEKFSNRYTLSEKAIGLDAGRFSFSIEETGRYGGLGLSTGESIEVEVLDINTVLSEILSRHQTIDILKLDIEGLEIKCVEKINHLLLQKIRTIYFEGNPHKPLHSGLFNQKQYNDVCVLSNKFI